MLINQTNRLCFVNVKLYEIIIICLYKMLQNAYLCTAVLGGNMFTTHISFGSEVVGGRWMSVVLFMCSRTPLCVFHCLIWVTWSRLRQPEAQFTVIQCLGLVASPSFWYIFWDQSVLGKSVSLLQRQTSFVRKLWALIISRKQLQ